MFYLLERFNNVNTPGDEGKNFCPLCLIDVSIIAIHASGGGGGAVQLETLFHL